MAILLINANGTIGDLLARRLVAQGDEVRAVERFPEVEDAWREIGVYVARGDPSDPDLIARAAHGARSIVVMEDEVEDARSVMPAVISGAREAGVERLILFVWKPADETIQMVTGSGLDYVVLIAGKRKLFGKNPDPGRLAAAIDAADDLASPQRVVLYLSSVDAWQALGMG